MSGNTLKLDTGVDWEAKNKLSRLTFSLNSDITLPLWKIGGILGIFLLFRNQLRIDKQDFAAFDGSFIFLLISPCTYF